MLFALLLGVAVGRATADEEPPPGPTCRCVPPCKPSEWCRFGGDSVCYCEAVE